MIADRITDDIPDADIDIRALPEGTSLLGGQYRIKSYLSSGGFGITYLAQDSLERNVVIKECFPEALCSRRNKTVVARSHKCTNEFYELVKMFVREARSLSRLDHPNIVGVHQIFEDNETAYMALDYVEGTNLLALIDDPKTRFTPAQVVELTRTLLDAISAVHDADMLHRDISPDNILLDRDGNPILIDFGAAREEAKKKSRAVSALLVVKDGYSPQEFYISGGMQGPSSDLYSLAATLYHVITGRIPPNSQVRLSALAGHKPDPYIPLTRHTVGYQPAFLRAIDLTLNVFPNDRPQTARDWLSLIDGTFTGSVTSLSDLQEVISDLVTEVAKNIDQDSKEELEEETEIQALPVQEKPIEPEKDRWWPLTEPIEEEPEPEVIEEPDDALATAVQPDERNRKTRRRLSVLVLAGAAWLSTYNGTGDFNAELIDEIRLLIENTIQVVLRA